MHNLICAKWKLTPTYTDFMLKVNAGSTTKPFNSTTKLDMEMVTSAGWGSIFSWQDPSDTNSDSSCMTSHIGPKDYRFKFCDMKFVKVQLNFPVFYSIYS